MGWLRDCCFLLGLAIAGVGFWMLSPPLALVVVGGNLMGISVWGAIRAAR